MDLFPEPRRIALLPAVRAAGSNQAMIRKTASSELVSCRDTPLPGATIAGFGETEGT